MISYKKHLYALLVVLTVTLSFYGAVQAYSVGPIYNPATGHAYAVTNDTDLWDNWKNATDNNQFIFDNMVGYLMTITSQDEEDFRTANDLVGFTSGRRTIADFNSWEWWSGPEAGTIFYFKNATAAICYTYCAWAGVEPTGGTEDVLQALANTWNDAAHTVAFQAIIEFGGICVDSFSWNGTACVTTISPSSLPSPSQLSSFLPSASSSVSPSIGVVSTSVSPSAGASNQLPSIARSGVNPNPVNPTSTTSTTGRSGTTGRRSSTGTTGKKKGTTGRKGTTGSPSGASNLKLQIGSAIVVLATIIAVLL